jgi:UDP-sulfoquinovose synthase
VELAAANPPAPGELRILNQFTETFSVNELAERVVEAGRQRGLEVTICAIPNPRQEKEEHYYNPAHSGLFELGLCPNYITTEVLIEMLDMVRAHQSHINVARILPRVAWNRSTAA